MQFKEQNFEIFYTKRATNLSTNGFKKEFDICLSNLDLKENTTINLFLVDVQQTHQTKS